MEYPRANRPTRQEVLTSVKGLMDAYAKIMSGLPGEAGCGCYVRARIEDFNSELLHEIEDCLCSQEHCNGSIPRNSYPSPGCGLDRPTILVINTISGVMNDLASFLGDPSMNAADRRFAEFQLRLAMNKPQTPLFTFWSPGQLKWLDRFLSRWRLRLLPLFNLMAVAASLGFALALVVAGASNLLGVRLW